jgi:hypothetical protein
MAACEACEASVLLGRLVAKASERAPHSRSIVDCESSVLLALAKGVIISGGDPADLADIASFQGESFVPSAHEGRKAKKER